MPRDPKTIKSLRVPSVQKSQELQTEARQKRLYAHAHTYHINSISVNRCVVWGNKDGTPGFRRK